MCRCPLALRAAAVTLVHTFLVRGVECLVPQYFPFQ